MNYPPPLIILGSPRSFTSLTCAMLGQHPEAYGFPELNLFLKERIDELIEFMSGYKQIQLHGLLRTVAHLYSGEQSLLSLEMARRWLMPRMQSTTVDVYKELCERIAPLRGIDKSPAYSQHRITLMRIGEAFPDAYYLHLVRNPRTQGESIMNVAHGVMAVLSNSIDYSTDPPTVDPQISWQEVQETILAYLENIPEDRKLCLRGEAVLSDPEPYLRRICRWLGMADDDRAVTAMLHPEDSPFACLGPLGAHLGNDINFLQSPALRRGTVRCPSLEGPLPWRRDGRGFSDSVLGLARTLGYDRVAAH
jgi:hypothetical protein